MKGVIQRAIAIDRKFQVFNTLADRLEAEGGGRLAGIAVSVKDNICTKNMVTTAGSRILEGYKPPFDATVVEKCTETLTTPRGAAAAAPAEQPV